MPYIDAYALLQNPNCSAIDLLNCFEELAMEYGYIAGTVKRGIRSREAETDLVRMFMLLEIMKIRIQQKL